MTRWRRHERYPGYWDNGENGCVHVAAIMLIVIGWAALSIYLSVKTLSGK